MYIDDIDDWNDYSNYYKLSFKPDHLFAISKGRGEGYILELKLMEEINYIFTEYSLYDNADDNLKHEIERCIKFLFLLIIIKTIRLI